MWNLFIPFLSAAAGNRSMSRDTPGAWLVRWGSSGICCGQGSKIVPRPAKMAQELDVRSRPQSSGFGSEKRPESEDQTVLAELRLSGSPRHAPVAGGLPSGYAEEPYERNGGGR